MIIGCTDGLFTSSLRDVIVIIIVTIRWKCYGVSVKITADFGTKAQITSNLELVNYYRLFEMLEFRKRSKTRATSSTKV